MQDRSVAKVIILSLLTLGFYTLYWLYLTRRERAAKDYDVPPLYVLFLPILVFLAVIFLVASTGSDTSNSADSNGFGLAATMGLILSFVALFAVNLYWFYKYCKAVDQVTKGQTSFGLTYTLYITMTIFGVTFLWPGIVQDGLNKVKSA